MLNLRYIIDHFEENFAVCENESGELVDIERSKLPEDAQEGDVLLFENNQYTINKSETDKLRKEIEDLMDELFED